jgi:hypothetical protein
VAAARRGSSGWRGGERVRCLRWAQLLTSGGRLYRSEMRRETCTERAAALCGRLRRRAAAPSGDEKRETCVEQAAMLSRWLLASGKRRRRQAATTSSMGRDWWCGVELTVARVADRSGSAGETASDKRVPPFYGLKITDPLEPPQSWIAKPVDFHENRRN